MTDQVRTLRHPAKAVAWWLMIVCGGLVSGGCESTRSVLAVFPSDNDRSTVAEDGQSVSSSMLGDWNDILASATVAASRNEMTVVNTTDELGESSDPLDTHLRIEFITISDEPAILIAERDAAPSGRRAIDAPPETIRLKVSVGTIPEQPRNIRKARRLLRSVMHRIADLRDRDVAPVQPEDATIAPLPPPAAQR